MAGTIASSAGATITQMEGLTTAKPSEVSVGRVASELSVSTGPMAFCRSPRLIPP